VIYNTIINFSEKDDVFGKWLQNTLNPPEFPNGAMQEESDEEAGDDEGKPNSRGKNNKVAEE